jgi:hypothetical protein
MPRYHDTEQPGAYESSLSDATLARVAAESSRYGMILSPAV